MDLNKLRKKLNDANTSTGSKPKTSSKSSKGVSGQSEKLKNSLSSLQDRAERSQMDKLRGMASEAAGKNTRRTVTDANRRTLTSTASSNRDISSDLNVLRDRLRERLGNQSQMPVVHEERRMTDFSGMVGGYNSIMDSMEGLRNADLPEPRQTRRSTPGYTGGVLEAEDRLQLNRTLLDVYDASAPLRNRTYESVPVYGRELTQDETDAALTRLDADIAAARESGAPQWYIDKLMSARDDYAANPSQYRDLNLEQSWEVAENAAPDGKRDTLVQGIRNAEEDLWMRQQANRWSLAAQRAARDGWQFDDADYEQWRERMKGELAKNSTVNPHSVSSDMRLYYTKDEAAVYAYLEEQGRSDDVAAYYSYMQPIAAERRNAEIAEDVLELGTIGRTAVAIAANPLKVFNGLSVMLQEIDRGISGSARPVDYHTYGQYGVAGNLARESVTQQLAAYGSLNDLISRTTGSEVHIPLIGDLTWGDIYGLGLDQINSLTNTLLFGKGLAGAAMFAQAGTDAYVNAQERGLNDSQALLSAVFSGAAEGIGEQIGLSALWRGWEKTAGKGLKGILAFGLLQGLEGGAQEAATTAMEQAADRLFLGDYSEYSMRVAELVAEGYEQYTAETIASDEAWDEILKSGLMGALGQGGTYVAGAPIAAYRNNYAVGADIKAQGNADVLTEWYNEISNKDKATPKTTAGVGRMYNDLVNNAGKYVRNIERSEMDAAIEERYKEELGSVDTMTKQQQAIRDALIRIGRNKNVRYSKDVSSNAPHTLHEIKFGDIEPNRSKSTGASFKAAMAPALRHVPLAETKSETSTEREPFATTEETRAKAEQRQQDITVDAAAASATVNGEAVTVQDVVATAQGDTPAKVRVTDSDGQSREVNINDVVYNDVRMAELHSYAEDMASPELANQFIAAAGNNQDLDQLANAMNNAWDMGNAGYRIDSARKSILTKGLTEQQLTDVFNLGASARSAEIQRKADIAARRQQANANKRWTSGRIHMGDVVMDGLSDEQKRDLDIVDVIAKEFGINIELFESKADKDGNYQGERGSYDPKTNTIRLDVRAGVNKVGDSFAGTTMLKTVAHELTHSLQRNSPEQYEAYKNAVLDVLEKNGQDIEEMVDARMAEDSSLTREAAIDEIVADASETMLRDSDLMNRLQELHQEEAKTFIQKVLDLLKRIKDAIREAFEGVELSKEAQAIMSDIDRLAAQWSDLAVEAAEVSGREIEIAPDVQQRINNDQAIDGIDEVKNSIRHDEKYMAAAVKRNRELGYITPEAMREAEKARATVRDFFRDPKNTELLKLPADVTGKTFYANSSYDGSEENTTVCIRSMAAQQLMDEVAKDLGRPLTVQDTLLISQEIASLTDRPECFYCYVATDRRAYREYLGDYLKQRDEVIRKYKGGADRTSLYREFLDGRKPTQNMEDRFNMWLDAVDKGAELITGKDLASLEDLFAEIGGRKKKKKPTTSRLDQLQDAAAYAQSASWAKKMNGYAAYNNHILKWTQKRVDDLNKGYGLRMYSFSDYSPAFVLENMQMITDAAVRGLNVLAYTKEMDFAEIFAPTGANINISVFATEVNGQITSDAMQGADWARAQELRSKFDNVGTVMVATNDRIMQWAMEQDWIDVVIPYHLVRTGKAVAKYFGYKDYTSVSADRKTLNYKEGDPTSVSPVEHHNEIVDYVNALQKYGLTPRFEDQIQGYVDFVAGDITPEQFREMNPYYMKLVNETRRSYADTKPVQPVFNTDAAMASIDTMIKQGGYYQPIGGSMEKQSDIAEEIAGKIRDEDSIRYSTRRADNISDREILANVLEDAVQNEDERELIEEYRSKLSDLAENQKQLDAARAIIRELAFKPRSEYAEGDLQRLETAREDAKRLANKLARADKRLLKMQAMTPVKNVLARARQQAEVRMRLRKDEQLRDYRSRREATQLRKTVIRKASNLDKLLRNPTDKRHLPDYLRKPVLDLMQVFTSIDNAFGGSQQALAKIAACRRGYEQLRTAAENPNGTDNYVAGRYDDTIAVWIKSLEDVIVEKREQGLYEFDSEELRKINSIIDHFEYLVRQGNKEYIDGKRVETGKILTDLYNIMYDETTGRPKYNAGRSVLQKIKGVGNGLNGFHTSNLTPVYFFRMLGGPLEQLGNSIINADAEFGLNYASAKRRLTELQDEYHYNSWANNNKDTVTITADNGAELKLTREQALCIWATDKRERGSDVETHHLALGGVILDDRYSKSNFNGEVTETTGSPLGREALDKINDWLTDEQKRYADAMVAYVSNDMASLGNETSMELHGYRKFRIGGYYFPFRTPSDFVRKEAGTSIDVAMYKNEGFTKPLQPGASTPVLVTDFSDAIANHVERMCKYHALAVPQDTLQRILNYKAEKNVSVESMIRGYYGTADINNYMRRFLSDIHDKRSDPSNWIGKAAGRMAAASRRGTVQGSLSVVFQQPSAMTRVFAIVNIKYYRKPVGSLKAFEEAKKYSGVAVLKDIGGFDAGMSSSTTDWLLGRSDQWRRKHGRTGEKISQFNDKLWSTAPEIADKLTWGEIWNIVKREQADVTGLDIDSEQLKQIAGKRMDEVCRRTQVYDSVMVKSQNMREGGLTKMFTSFMAEPTVTYNMVADAMREGLSGNVKAAIGTTAAVVASIIYNNVLKSLVMAARDDDDEKAPYFERMVRSIWDGTFNDFVIFNYMPIARDVWSVLLGYDVERADTSIITKGRAFISVLANEEKTVDDKLYSAAQFLGTMLPVPLGNIWREVRAVKNTFGKKAVSDNEWRDNWFKYSLRDAAQDNAPLYYMLGPSDAERLYSAALEGDDAAVAEQRQYMIDYKDKDDKKINSALRSEIKKAHKNGEIDDERAISMLTEYTGMEADDAYMKVEEWEYEYSKKGDWTKTAKVTDAIDSGDDKALAAAVEELVEYGGYDSPKDAAQSIASGITSTYKPLYIAASPAERKQMKVMLLDAYETVYETAGLEFYRDSRSKSIDKWLD